MTRRSLSRPPFPIVDCDQATPSLCRLSQISLNRSEKRRDRFDIHLSIIQIVRNRDSHRLNSIVESGELIRDVGREGHLNGSIRAVNACVVLRLNTLVVLAGSRKFLTLLEVGKKGIPSPASLVESQRQDRFILARNDSPSFRTEIGPAVIIRLVSASPCENSNNFD